MRGEIPFVVQALTGAALSGASVLVNTRGSGAATIYAAETGSGTLPNPLTTGAEGRIDGWLDEGSYDLVISGATIATYLQPLEVVRGDGVGRIATNAVPTAALQNASVTYAKLAADVTTNLLPSGTIAMFAGSSAPAGWALCDGTAYNGTLSQYTPLWSVLGTLYGGSGQTSFKVPDLRGRSPMGAGAGSGLTTRALAGTLGEEGHALITAENASHTHTGVTDNSGSLDHTHSGTTGTENQSLSHVHAAVASGQYVPGSTGGYSIVGTAGGGNLVVNAGNVSSNLFTGGGGPNAHNHNFSTGGSSIGGLIHAHSITTAASGSGTAHNTVHPVLVVNFIVKL